MKIIVVGASSFTGKHFCEYAEAQGAEVLAESMRSIHWACYAQDAYVVNFAAVNVVAPSWNSPGKYMKVNVGRVTEVADALRNFMPARYVHISTPEVYGNTTGHVLEEAPYNPSTPYAVSRASAEMMLQCYRKQYGLPVVFTRSANVYGPGQQLYRLIPKLIASIKHGKPFPLEGGGSSKRAFLHVQDACAAIWDVMLKGQIGEAYNITRLKTDSIEDIAFMTCSLMGVKAKDVLEIAPERPGKDAGYFLIDDKIRALGWYDRISLGKGIDSVIKWINDNWDTLQHQSLEYNHKP